jgi:ornithine cyclodeaminase/alanine dehydrogenase-like protein (mu-crystallin family)
MKYFDAEIVHKTIDYLGFIPFLKEQFAKEIEVPNRTHHNFEANTLLLMPAWNDKYLGTKLVTVHPNNTILPAINGMYFLQSSITGQAIATFEAKSLTIKRTAAASALASSFLSNPKSSKLLMIGNGALAPELIKAHSTVRPIKEVWIWGRNGNRVDEWIEKTDWQGLTVKRATSIKEAVQLVDIISCATFSKTPLIVGELLQYGQHIDLVGSYQPDMREADDSVIQRSSVFVDTFYGIKESGDLSIPLSNGVLDKSDIKSDLKSLCLNINQGRTSEKEITLFKSVGYALEDLAAATYIYEHF